MKVFQPLGLAHKVRISQNNEIHVSNPVKVLILDLPESFNRVIIVPIKGDELIVWISVHLKQKVGTAQLTLHNRRRNRIAHIPHLQLLRGLGKAVLIHLINIISFRIAEQHLRINKTQVAPSIDDDVIHIADGSSCRSSIVLDGDGHRITTRIGTHPTADLMGIFGTCGTGTLDIIGGFLHIVYQHVKGCRSEITSRQFRPDHTRTRGVNPWKLEIEGL